jgi:saccharopine dehydrogenase-like NADP-dependent oxidoreductase
MKILVMGVGGMGEPLAWALKKLGAEVIVGDINEDTLHKVHQKLDCEKTRCTIGRYDFVLAEPDLDLVVSCVPYEMTTLIARECVVYGVRYCDLGGNPQVSEGVQSLYKDTQSVCFTDLGLAPGLANIIAEYGVHTHLPPNTVELMCGGLPVHPAGTLKYNLVFHPHGLWNELTGDCEILKDGLVTQVRALSKVTELGEKLEVAHTKGGLSSSLKLMKDRGVQNCSYQTIRFKGHYDYINFLLTDCGLREDSSTFERLISYACPKTTLDRVFLRIKVDDWVSESVIENDDDWSAMQKGTAFPTAAVAMLMAAGEMDSFGPVLNYSHIPLEKFIDNLHNIGGMPVNKMFPKRECDIGYCFMDYLL